MRPTLDLDAVVAIDVYTHVQPSVDGGGFPDDSPEKAVAERDTLIPGLGPTAG
ncbi:MAG: hypothetical protein QOF29_6 [bacterium]|jgi:hypothetical protein